MIIVYTKNNCEYCERAKEYLDHYNIKYTVINVNESETALNFIRENHKTVPQIYSDGKLFVENGYSGLVLMDPEKLRERM